jgi:hypothetical protein
MGSDQNKQGRGEFRSAMFAKADAFWDQLPSRNEQRCATSAN